MLAGIGHNRGPSIEPGTGWRTHCWGRSRAALLGERLPVEVVRSRVRRARELGLDYKAYAGVRSTTGRDVIAFLFSSNGLGVFRDGQLPARDVGARIATIRADRDLGTAPGIDARRLAAAMVARDGGAIISARALPGFGASWPAMRDDMKSWLRDRGLPGDAVVMIGETDHERELAQAGGLAGFISGQDYFALSPAA